MNTRKAKTIGFLIFDGIQGLDMLGPQEAFGGANEFVNGSPVYDTVLISEKGDSVTTDHGVQICAHTSFSQCPDLDTLIIPGGTGSRNPKHIDTTIPWVKEKSATTRRTGSICTGLFILAQTGLLKDKTVTTHWQYAELAAQRFPDLEVNADALFIRDGGYFTAAGVSSGIDIALALIEEDCGAKVATQVARDLVVFLKRPGGQNQFSSFLQQQTALEDNFNELIPWIAENLDKDLSIETLATKANLSERHFRRKFKSTFNSPPATMVESLRIETAKERLSHSKARVEDIARSVGFASADAFRRSFERRVGISPSHYRQRFTPIGA